MSTPTLYDLSDGWTCSTERYPSPEDYPVWAWVEGGHSHANFITAEEGGLRKGSDVYWKPASVPLPPRRRTEQELEQDAILAVWCGQGIDYAQDEWRDIPNSFLAGWNKCRDWARAQKDAK